MPYRFRILATAVLFTAGAASLPAQATGPALPRVAVTFAPKAGPDTVVFRRSVARDGVNSDAGTRTVILRTHEAPDGVRLLEVVQRFPGGGGEIVDTAVAELATFRAVAHQSHQPSKTMRFAFDGNGVGGTVAGTGSASDSVTQVRLDLGGPVFDSNVIELVVAALPLREGLSAELPFFIYERGGRVPMLVTVRERVTAEFGSHGPREAWVVAVDVPGAPATVWVDARSRAVLRVRYDISARAMSFTDERLTPLHG